MNRPPSCLSIQFATIQVIHYKPQDSDHIESPHSIDNDIRNWPDSCVKKVSILIAKQVPKINEEHQIQHKQSFLDKTPNSTLSNSTEDNLASSNKLLAKSKKSNQNQIVISAHPMQKKLADDLRLNLQKENYEVWVSTDFIDLMSPLSNAIVSIDYPETPDSMIESPMASLSTISEITENNSSRITSSNTIENDIKKSSLDKLIDLQQQNCLKAINNLASLNSTNSTNSNSILQQTPVKRPTSLPISKTDNSFINVEKRQIKRLPSQISEISISNNTLTPEKMQRLTQFQDKVANSKLVIFLISDAYFRSRTSKVCFLKFC